jgi:uncharacterized protein (TIGR00730 family)
LRVGATIERQGWATRPRIALAVKENAMPGIRSVAVFCGASAGHDPAFREAAGELGRGLARAGIRLVYGGGRIGLMGAVADATLAAGGDVIGVIPDFLRQAEVAHEGVADLLVTDTMHTRKQRMFELSDAFVSFPGGLGTLDETFEILTWKQLKLHAKPILICDVAGSARPLLATIEAAIETGFARPEIRALYEITTSVSDTLALLSRLTMAAEGESARL